MRSQMCLVRVPPRVPPPNDGNLDEEGEDDDDEDADEDEDEDEE